MASLFFHNHFQGSGKLHSPGPGKNPSAGTVTTANCSSINRLNRQSLSNCIIIICLLSVCVVVRLPFYFPSVIHWDESTFILMGQSINDGHLPYVQLWDIKPPLAFLFFAIATLLWKSIIAVRIAGTLCVFAIAYFVFRIGEYIWESKAGLFAAVLSILFVSVSDSGQATMTEIIALVPIMGALVLLVTREMNWVTCLMTGFLLSLATLVRLNLGYLAAAVGILIPYLSLFSSRSFVKQTAAYVLGGLLPVGAVALPYFIGGYQELLVASVVKASWQFSRSSSVSEVLAILLSQGFNVSNVVLWVGCLGGIAIIAMEWSKYNKIQKNGIFSIAVFFVAVGSSIALGGHARLRYLIQWVPFLSLIAGGFFAFLGNSFHKKVIALLCLGLVIPARPILAEYMSIGKKVATNQPLVFDKGYRIAAYLNSENVTGKVLCLSTYHIVHWLTGTRPIRKSVTHPANIGKEYLLKSFLGANASTKGEMIALLSAKPLYIVKDKQFDYLNNAAQRILEETLRADYVLVQIISDTYIYKRRGDLPAGV